MGIFDFLFGKKGQTERLPTMDPQQQQMWNQFLSQMGSLGPDAFGALGQMLSGEEAPWEQAAKTQFEQEIVPGIAERFSSLGEGAQGSSAFGQQLGQAGAGLAERLAAMRGQERQYGLGLYGQLMGQGLGTRGFENMYRPGTQGFLGGAAQGLFGGFGSALGNRMGNWQFN